MIGNIFGVILAMNTISDRIATRLNELGLKQVDLIEATGLTKGAVSKWVTGTTVPSSEHISAIAKKLKVSPEWLLTGKQSNHYENSQLNQVNNSYINGSVNQSVVHNNYPDCPIDEYWLTIANNDMFPTFSIGDSIRIDEKREPQAGNYVLVECEGLEILRKYRPKGFDENGKPYTQLVADNEDYPIIDSRYQTFTVLGVAVEHKRKLV